MPMCASFFLRRFSLFVLLMGAAFADHDDHVIGAATEPAAYICKQNHKSVSRAGLPPRDFMQDACRICGFYLHNNNA